MKHKRFPCWTNGTALDGVQWNIPLRKFSSNEQIFRHICKKMSEIVLTMYAETELKATTHKRRGEKYRTNFLGMNRIFLCGENQLSDPKVESARFLWA